MLKSTEKEAALVKEIEQRKSLRAYMPTPIEQDKIRTLFEAARWAPSSNNEQPWVYMYATRDQSELWSKLFDVLLEGNKIWVVNAPMIVLSMVRKNYIRHDRPNTMAQYDLGAANAFLSLQATQLGLNVHQLGGFDREKAITTLNIPETHEPVVMMAIGYAGPTDSLPENLKLREEAPRERYMQQYFVMNKTF